MNRFAAPLCALIAALALAACSREAPEPETSSGTPAAEAPAPASEPQAESSTPAAEAEATEETAGTPTETITETDEAAETPVSTSVQPSLRLGATPRPATSGRFREGQHYRKIVPAQPTGVSPGKVEVAEVFWYGCPHCFTLDPAIESWRAKNKPAYVEFVRIPAMWNDQLRMHARLFYTAEALGKLEELHTLIFREIQVNRNFLDSEEKIAAFFRQHGVSSEQFKSTFSSFAVESKLKRADLLNRRYGVDSVPMLIVNGKYATQVDMAGGERPLFELIGELAASEHGG